MATQLSAEDLRRMVAAWPRELRVAVLQVLREMESEAEPEPPVDRQSSSHASGSTASHSGGTIYRRPGFWCGIPCSCSGRGLVTALGRIIAIPVCRAGGSSRRLSMSDVSNICMLGRASVS